MVEPMAIELLKQGGRMTSDTTVTFNILAFESRLLWKYKIFENMKYNAV